MSDNLAICDWIIFNKDDNSIMPPLCENLPYVEMPIMDEDGFLNITDTRDDQ